MKSILVLLGVLMFSGIECQAKFLPTNDLYKQDNLNLRSGITQTQFNAVIDQVSAVFAPVISSHGGKLVVNRLWTNATVNASSQQVGSSWSLNMYGGLARRPEITSDGFTLVMCHELGHHLGGFSFINSGWAANEGEADYFASQVCVKKVWANDSANASAANSVDSFARAQCNKAYTKATEQNLCYRTANASQSVANLFASASGVSPEFDKPDPSAVRKTNNDHPAAQCRLDTYFEASLCTASFDIKIIPGRNISGGQQSAAAEKEGYKYSCGLANGNTVGNRPLCWFKPNVQPTKKKLTLAINE